MTGHFKQLVLPVHCWYLPAAHETHVCAPSSLCASVLNCPLGQSEHAEEPTTANCPGVQRVQRGAFVMLE